MKVPVRMLAAGAAICAFVVLCGFATTPAEGPVTDYIVTAAPAYKPLAELQGGERFPEGARLLLVHAGKTEPIVAGFAASADANVSYDGKRVLFAGKKTVNDPWQIWEMTLADRSVRRVVTTDSDAERPFYLPGGRLIWAQRTPAGFQLDSSDDGRPAEAVYANPTAGPGILPLTHFRGSAFPTGILHDGRILFEAAYPMGSGATPEVYLVYADGSGVESYRCDHGRGRWGAAQIASGDVIFTHGSSLARFTSPLAHEEAIAAPRGEYAGAVVETRPGNWMVSARTGADAHFAIKAWKPGAAVIRTILSVSGEDLVEPVMIAAHERPNRHPSGLHPWDYANLLALDARQSRDGGLQGVPAAVRVETEDAAGNARVMGTAPVEADGSFYIRIPGGTPVRIALLDAKGTVLRAEHGWHWSRGGEQRICTGCHAGPEHAAENRVPAVLERTTAPVDLTGKGGLSK